MPVIRLGFVLVIFGMTAVFSNYAFAQDSTTSDSDQSSATGSAPSSGNSTSTGNTTISSNSTTSTPSQTTQASVGLANVTVVSPDQFTADQQQWQQLTQQLAQQMATATPDERAAVANSYRQQTSTLAASTEPPPFTSEQAAQLAARQAAFMQKLPVEDQPAYGLMLQIQQIGQQMTGATPEQRLVLVGQIHDLTAQQDALKAQQSGPPPSPAKIVQEQIAWIATLPPEDQTVMAGLIQRGRAIQATTQLPAEQRAAAIQNILAQPLPTTSGNLTSNADPISGNVTTNVLPSAPVSSPPSGQ